MANPSIQIGNNKWAIKEDSLLGYTELGNNIAPVEIDMTRATAGTRVNSSGLVETVELLGSEDVVNGDFATDSDWNKGTGWTISGGNANSDGSGTSFLYQTISNVQTKSFLIEYEVKNYVSGSVSVVLGSAGSDQLTSSSNGVVSGTVVWDGTSDRLNFKSVSLNGSIDNVSVKEVTQNNLARVNYTGSTSSLLAEPQRTNLLPYSEDFSQWSAISGASVAINTAISPSGETDADTITYDGTTYGRVEKGIAVTNGNTYTSSVYLKNNNLSDVTQVWLGFSMGGQGEFVTITNEWQRYETVQVANGNNEYPRVQFTGTGSLYVWGAQMEAGSYATSYIPTNGEAGGVTRVQDQYSKSGIANLINSEEGVLFVEMAALSNDSTNRMLSLYGSGNDKLTLFYKTASNSMTVQGFVGGSLQINRTVVLTDITQFSKIAIRYKTNDFAWYVDGAKVTDDTTTNTWSANTLTKLSFDDGASGNPLFAKVKQLRVYDTALTDEELIQITGTSGTDFYKSYAEAAAASTYIIQ